MQISRTWCGFTGGQADTLRKAVGKKKIELMNKLKPEFIKGAVEIGGATEEIAETFWTQLLEFANYCFNKAHAACYGLIAYWTAYLKAHYPDAFMAALMTSDMRWTDRLAIEMAECKHMGIKVLGPDINQSYGDFGIVPGEKTIRFGLSGIKSMGKALVEEAVLPEREANGPFKSVCDFAKRVNSTKFNKRSWEAAIKTGAFDRFGTRSDLLYNLDNIQAYGQKVQKDKANGQTDLFGAFGSAGEIPEPEIGPSPVQATEKEQLLWERDLMGLYLSAHPLDKYDTFFEEQTHPYSVVCQENDDKTVTIGGIISAVRTILTKSGTKMAFIKLENKSYEQEIIAFPQTYEQYGAKLVQDNVVKVIGRVNAKDKDGRMTSEVKVIIESVEVISDEMLENYHSTGEKIPAPVAAPRRGGRGGKKVRYVPQQATSQPRRPATEQGHSAPESTTSDTTTRIAPPPDDPRHKKLFVLIKDPNNTECLTEVKHLCDLNPGFQEIILVLKNGEDKKPLRMPFKVDACDELTTPLKSLLGDECVVVK